MTELANLSVSPRFNGPADSANGGVVSGLLAARLDGGAVTVTLRQPPPLGVQLRIEQHEQRLRAFDGTVLIAEADRGSDAELAPVDPVDLTVAVQAAGRYPGFHDHPFPTCFGCGTARPGRDGLCVFAGPVDPSEPRRVASPFRPRLDLGLPDEVQVWAALDCPGGWSIGLADRRAVLGRMTAQVFDVPEPDELCVVVGACDGWEGRKASARSTLYGADERVLGTASQIWIELG